MGFNTPNKFETRASTSRIQKLSANTKRSAARRNMPGTQATAKSLFAGSVGHSDAGEDTWVLNRRIRALESDLNDRDSSLLHMNVEHSKFMSSNQQLDKLKEENRKLKGIQKNWHDLETQRRELQLKYDKLQVNYEILRTKHDTLQATHTGLELVTDRERSIKLELQGKVERADQDLRMQHDINQELNQRIRDLEVAQNTSQNKIKQLEAKNKKLTKELKEAKDLAHKYRQEEMKLQDQLRRLEIDNVYLKKEIKKLVEDNKGLSSKGTHKSSSITDLKLEMRKFTEDLKSKYFHQFEFTNSSHRSIRS